VRLAGVFAQAMQHRRQRAADGRGQRQRGQRVGGVVAAAHAQRVGGHQALQVDLFFVVDPGVAGPPQDAWLPLGDGRRRATALGPRLAFEGLVGRQRAHQPGHAVLDHEAEVARAARGVGAEADDGGRHGSVGELELALGGWGRRGHQRLDGGVVTVDDHHRLGARRVAKYTRLGRRVGGQGAMPVEVVLCDVQHCGGGRREAAHAAATAFELETRQLQHPDLGQRGLGTGGGGVELRGQGVEQRGADVARRRHPSAGAPDQQGRHRGGGGLAVGAGDGQQPRCVALQLLQVGQRTHEEVKLAQHGDAGVARLLQQRRHARVGRGQAGALQHQLPAGHLRRRERAADALHRRPFGGQGRGARRLLARVPHRHLRAAARAPARHRQAAVAEAEDEDGQVAQEVHAAVSAGPSQGDRAPPWGAENEVSWGAIWSLSAASGSPGPPGTAAW